MDHYPEVNVSARSTSIDAKAHHVAVQPLPRNDSTHSASTEESQTIDDEYAHYTDAPPKFEEEQYEGKSEEQQTAMRRSDYAKELNRMMGRQLVKGLKADVDARSP